MPAQVNGTQAKQHVGSIKVLIDGTELGPDFA